MELITLSPYVDLTNLRLTAFFILGAVEYSFRMKIIIIPDYALDFIRKEIRQNSCEARKFCTADVALATLRTEN
jgi:hypothetical protein